MSTSLKHAPPYLRSQRRTGSIMSDVCIALIPPAVSAVWFFGIRAVWMLLTALGVSLLTDRLSAHLLGIAHPFDGSALVTGSILALSCPVGTPLWLLAVMCAVAIAVFRDAFGGIGANLLNPAMAARALLLTVFPAYLADYALPDAVSSATPLSGGDPDLLSLFFGRVGGSIGETSALLILLGAGYLLVRRVIRWQMPVLSVAAFALVIALGGGDVPRQILSGSLLFGAVYIFTDYTGSPTTPFGEMLFAVGAGALTAALRLWGRYPEGVCFAVLIMNFLTPLLDRCTRPRVYGTKRKERSA